MQSSSVILRRTAAAWSSAIRISARWSRRADASSGQGLVLRRDPALCRGRLLAAALWRAEKLAIERHALEPVVQAKQVGEAYAAMHLGRVAGHVASDLAEMRLGMAGRHPGLVRHLILGIGSVDRKSTRLNSSH